VYRIEANKDEIYYNHGLQWHGPFTEAEDDNKANVTCETCGKQFDTTQDLVQHEKDEHSEQAVERLERLYQANLPVMTESSRKAFLSTCPHCGDEGEEVQIIERRSRSIHINYIKMDPEYQYRRSEIGS
jgi:DNA-directed RNA polymerase subunit M/transcription elongation factor TFIIS